MNIFTLGSNPKIALLIKNTLLHKPDLIKYYQEPIDVDLLVIPLEDFSSAKLREEYLQEILPYINEANIELILVPDTNYFKKLAGVTKSDPHIGYIMEGKLKGYETKKIAYSLSYGSLIHKPDNINKINTANQAIKDYFNNSYQEIGKDIIHFEAYPSTFQEIQEWLYKLLQEPTLACDIETYGLALVEADLASIGFAWSQHEGIAFPVNDFIKPMLRDFFEAYKGTLVFHNASFDIKNIIYRCFMEHPLDTKGLLHGLDIMYRDIHDTKLIAYLATNSTSGNELGLKKLAYDFAGNYAVDVTDVSKVPIKDLLKYNLIDCLSTLYVANKYSPILIQDNQKAIYKELYLPSLKVITHMELVGMPMDLNQIEQAEASLTKTVNKYRKQLNKCPLIKDFTWKLNKQLFIETNKNYKKKFKPLEEFNTQFNPDSSVQLQKLLYSEMGFEIVDVTDKGSPATGKDTLEKMLNKLMKEYDITEEELNEQTTGNSKS